MAERKRSNHSRRGTSHRFKHGIKRKHGTRKPLVNKDYNGNGDKRGQNKRWEERQKESKPLEDKKIQEIVKQYLDSELTERQAHALIEEFPDDHEEETTTIFEEGLRRRIERKGIKTEKKRFYYAKSDGSKTYITPDITIPDRLLVIEVDGPGHLEEPQLSNDFLRDQTIRDNGFQVWHFQNEYLAKTSNLIEVVKTIEELPKGQKPKSWPTWALCKDCRKVIEGRFTYCYPCFEKHQNGDQPEEITVQPKEGLSTWKPTTTTTIMVDDKPDQKRCPYCNNRISSTQIMCRFCKAKEKSILRKKKFREFKNKIKYLLRKSWFQRRKLFRWIGIALIPVSIIIMLSLRYKLGVALLALGIILILEFFGIIFKICRVLSIICAVGWTIFCLVNKSTPMEWVLGVVLLVAAASLMWLVAVFFDHHNDS